MANINGSAGNDTLIGTDGDDTLAGLGGDDVLLGGLGNDVIDSRVGINEVIYRTGDGDDTVVVGSARGSLTYIRLDGNVVASDFVTEQVDGNLRLSFGAQPGSITVQNLSTTTPYVQFEYGSGGVVRGRFSYADLMWGLIGGQVSKGLALTGTEGADTLEGGLLRDTLVGGAGADVLKGSNGDDIYQGGAGDDLIIDQPAVDAASQNAAGSDTYLFGRGDGVDTVLDSDSANAFNTIQFGAGIGLADIEKVVRFSEGALDARSPVTPTQLTQTFYTIYRIKGTQDEIRFVNEDWSTDMLRFADGTLVSGGSAASGGVNITGTAAADVIWGSQDKDTIQGGLGDDTLVGGSEADQYIYTLGDGNDVIYDRGLAAPDGSGDTLVIHGNLDLGSLKFHREITGTYALRYSAGYPYNAFTYRYTDVIDLGGQGSIKLSWLQSDLFTGMMLTGYDLGVIERLQLDNGQSLSGQEILQRSLASGLTLQSAGTSEGLYGEFGNDLITGGVGNDTLVGNAGNDTMLGGEGNDELWCGPGNDLLDGGMAGDAYRYQVGDGADTVRAEPIDTILFGPGITKTDVVVGRLGAVEPNALVLQVGKNAADSITLRNAVTHATLNLQFNDGTTMSSDEILALATAPSGLQIIGTAGDDALIGQDKDDLLQGLAGNDTLAGGQGNDTLVGGAGINDLTGGEGADVYVISASATKDTLHSDAQDTIAFEAGITSANVIFESRSLRFGPGSSSSTPDPLAGLVFVSRDATSGYIKVNYDAAAKWGGVAFGDGVKTEGRMLVGTDGNDVLAWGGTVRGGKGNDVYDFSPSRTPEGPLAGGLTVLYDAGDGLDTVRAIPPFPSFFSFNTVKLGAGIGASDVLVDVTSTPDVIKLRFKGIDGGLDVGGLGQVVFNDGTVWNTNDINQRLLAGDNLFIGTSGNDTLSGGAGNDTLNGGSGNDVLLGGTGQNELTGGEGQDTYVVEAQESDILHVDADDTVSFGAGITLSNLVRSLDTSGKLASTDVLAQADAKGASLTFGSAAIMDALSLRFADGTAWLNQVLYGSEAGETLDAAAFKGTQVMYGQDGDDVLLGSSGDERLDGGAGSDTLTGGAGADTYEFFTWSGDDLVHADGKDTLLVHGVTSAGVSIGKLGAKGADIAVLSVQGGGTITLDHFSTLAGLSMRFDDGQAVAWADIYAAATKPDDLTLQGTANADTLKGGAGNDTLRGLAGNDSLVGAEGADVLIGGAGNDVLDGGAGADTYQFAIGDGADTVMADGLDTIAVGAGLSKANVQIGKLGAKSSNAVVLGMGSNATDTLTLSNAGSWSGLTLKFADGSTLSGADILLAATKPDNLTLTGTTKADALTGKDGNDTLNGLAGNDTLAGGKGNDSLIGGKGNDTYLFNRGEGQDVIVDTDSTLFNSDLLKLGGATSKQLWLTKTGKDLDIKILGTSDKVTVQNWFAGSSNQVEKITASDGKSLSASKVQALVNAMASFTPPADAASLPANTPAAVTKLIASSWA